MKTNPFLRRTVFQGAVLLLAAFRLAAAPEATKPNIVVILSDDYGWGSVGCYGARGVKTPNIDRLASEGRRFTHSLRTRLGLLAHALRSDDGPLLLARPRQGRQSAPRQRALAH